METQGCEHEWDPMPTGLVYDDSPLPRLPPGLESIVPCKKCGDPIDRGRFTGLIDNPYARMPVLPDNDDSCVEELEAEVLALKKRLVREMCISRTRTEMLEEFGDDYERYL